MLQSSEPNGRLTIIQIFADAKSPDLLVSACFLIYAILFLCYTLRKMPSKRKKKGDHEIFDSIRKPVAPPGQKLGGDKAEEKIHPAQRKIKHKQKPRLED